MHNSAKYFRANIYFPTAKAETKKIIVVDLLITDCPNMYMYLILEIECLKCYMMFVDGRY